MKNKFLTSLLILSAAAFVATVDIGCTSSTTVTSGTNASGGVVLATNTVRAFDPAVTEAGIQALVPLAVTVAVGKEPQAKPYLEAAVVAINTFALGTDFTPATLDAELTALIPKANAPQTLAAVNAGVSLYELAYAKVISGQMDKVTWLRPVLQSLASAIQQGLGTTQ